MKLIVGLGNPGAQYDRTRHNAGFIAVDALARDFASGSIAKSQFHAAVLDARISSEKVLLMKPTTYMNRSGQSVGEAIRFYKLDPSEDLIVLVDDIALPVGHVRVRQRGGSGGHNGLSDIDRVLGGEDYTRVRIGVGAVPRLMNQADWVLSRFMSEERDDVEQGTLEAKRAVELILNEGVTIAMNRINKKLPGKEPKPLPEQTNQTQRDSAATEHGEIK
jgi:PTH1 family peptidyl-tRNA hydrolase